MTYSYHIRELALASKEGGMAKREKLDQEVRSLPPSIRYADLAEWMEQNGWTFIREAENSHRFWRLNGVDAYSLPLHNKKVRREYVRAVIKITDRAN